MALAASLLIGATARAQEPPGGAPVAATYPQLLPRADFSFGWASLVTGDRRFDWQGQVGIDFDVVDFGSGRVSFRGDYEAILGRERRRYDLNQSHYFFEAAISARRGPFEAVALVQHVSRHAVDRDNEPAISWNTAAIRLRHAWAPAARRGPRVESSIEIGRVTQPAFVDYRWVSRAEVVSTAPMNARLAVVARARGEVIGVDRDVLNRPRVCGGRIEGALRVNGRAAALEIFGGYERRIDAFPTDRFRVRWFTGGFRIITR